MSKKDFMKLMKLNSYSDPKIITKQLGSSLDYGVSHIRCDFKYCPNIDGLGNIRSGLYKNSVFLQTINYGGYKSRIQETAPKRFDDALAKYKRWLEEWKSHE